MFDWFRKKSSEEHHDLIWPELSLEEIKRRARVLIIDDKGFAYGDLFRRDGYAIDEWKDVDNLSRIENGSFDLILLDMHGIGKSVTSDQGMGILRHIRKVAPSQLVVAFSDSDFSLKYHDFFKEADAILPKSADYVDFKRAVDDLLKSRFSLGFYLERVKSNVGLADYNSFVEKETKSAISSGDSSTLRQKLLERLSDKTTVEAVVGIAKIAEGIYHACKVG